MSVLEGVLLGCLEGITEFLPISSSGHISLIQNFLSLNETQTTALLGVLHIATAVAAVMYFRSDIWTVVQALLRKMGRLPVNDKDFILLKALLLGSVPAITVGFFIQPYASGSSQATGFVAIVLFLSAVFFMYAEWRYYNRPVHESVTGKKGFLVGLFQVLSLLPGFSRAGAVMSGGMLLGMSRYEAARFSFLLAIPVTTVAGIRKLLELIGATGSINWVPIVAGGIATFFVALLTIHVFLGYTKRYTLWPFIWYNVILACLVGYVSFIS